MRSSSAHTSAMRPEMTKRSTLPEAEAWRSTLVFSRAKVRYPLTPVAVEALQEFLWFPLWHFCGWDCVLRHAATKEPEQVVSGPSPPDD